MKNLLLDLKIFCFVTGRFIAVAFLLFAVVGCEGGSSRGGNINGLPDGHERVVHEVSEPSGEAMGALLVVFVGVALWMARRK